jgi:hypothetical protein
MASQPCHRGSSRASSEEGESFPLRCLAREGSPRPSHVAGASRPSIPRRWEGLLATCLRDQPRRHPQHTSPVQPPWTWRPSRRHCKLINSWMCETSTWDGHFADFKLYSTSLFTVHKHKVCLLITFQPSSTNLWARSDAGTERAMGEQDWWERIRAGEPLPL